MLIFLSKSEVLIVLAKTTEVPYGHTLEYVHRITIVLV